MDNKKRKWRISFLSHNYWWMPWEKPEDAFVHPDIQEIENRQPTFQIKAAYKIAAEYDGKVKIIGKQQKF